MWGFLALMRNTKLMQPKPLIALSCGTGKHLTYLTYYTVLTK